MKSMFEESEFKGDVSKWDVSSVIDMSFMFYHTYFDGDVSNWNTTHVVDTSFIIG